jgi:hypothetical protein
LYPEIEEVIARVWHNSMRLPTEGLGSGGYLSSGKKRSFKKKKAPSLKGEKARARDGILSS